MWWQYIHCCWLFWPMGSKHCNTNRRNVWTKKGTLQKKLHSSHFMNVSWSAYELSSWPSNILRLYLTEFASQKTLISCKQVELIKKYIDSLRRCYWYIFAVHLKIAFWNYFRLSVCWNSVLVDWKLQLVWSSYINQINQENSKSTEPIFVKSKLVHFHP